MDNVALTERMKGWLKHLYLEAAKDHNAAASNEHCWALGSKTQEQAMRHEENAEEHREFEYILKCLAAELNLD